MVDFETIRSEEKKFGVNNFIEIARKRAILDEGEKEFISVSRGFFTQDGSRRYKKSFTIPEEALDFVIERLKELMDEKSSQTEVQ